MKQLTINMRADDVAEVLLYDEIGSNDFFGGGVSAKDFREQIKGVKATTLNLRINSPGGSVTEGAAMLNALDEWKRAGRRIEVDVDGLAASAATVLMMAGNTIRVAGNGLVMIHDPSTMAVGNAEDMRRTADLLDKAKGQMLDTYMRRAKITREQMAAAMAAETWYTGAEAVAVGLADSVSAGQNMAAFANVKPLLARMKYKHVPTLLRAEMGMDDPCCFEVGDRIVVAGSPHRTGQTSGIVRQVVAGPAYGVEFDGAPGSVYQWYVGSEIMLEDPTEEQTEEAAVMDAEQATAKAATAAAWAETNRRREIAANLAR